MKNLYPVLYGYFNRDGSVEEVRFTTELFTDLEQAFNKLSGLGTPFVDKNWFPSDTYGQYKIIRLMTEWPVVNTWELG